MVLEQPPEIIMSLVSTNHSPAKSHMTQTQLSEWLTKMIDQQLQINQRKNELMVGKGSF